MDFHGERDYCILHSYTNLENQLNLLSQRSGITLLPIYATQSTPASRKAALFAYNFDESVVPIAYTLRDLDTVGAAVTLLQHSVRAEDYAGPVFLGIGDHRFILCLVTRLNHFQEQYE